MTSALDIHAASPAELAAAHRNVFDIWSKGLPLEEHVRQRLNSPSHGRARWFVGTLDGRVVASLGCYPLVFRLHGRELPGIAIGSVYTLKEVRGRGFAPQLLRWVEDHERQRGAALSVLYSDINPDYYARLGYALCPSLCGWRDPRGGAVLPERHTLVAISPGEHLPRLMTLYAEYHGGTPLSVARDEATWRAMLKKFPDDTFYALQSPLDDWCGYVRVGRKENRWRITDFALADESLSLAENLYAAFLKSAAAAGATQAGGWLPESAAARKFFELVPRATEITMVKPLAPQVALDSAAIAATSRFCEIDHV